MFNTMNQNDPLMLMCQCDKGVTESHNLLACDLLIINCCISASHIYVPYNITYTNLEYQINDALKHSYIRAANKSLVIRLHKQHKYI